MKMQASVLRNREARLCVFALILALGGYWLLSLGSDEASPENFVLFALVFLVTYGVAHFAVRKLAPKADPLLLPITAFLNGLGFIMIARLADAPVSAPASAQARWMLVAAGGFVATLYFIRDARSLARIRYTLALGGVAFLLLPLLPIIGREVNGARLWIKIGPLNFQPSEIAKIVLVVFVAALLSERKEVLSVATRRLGPIGIPHFRHFGPLILAWGISFLVMIFEKDLGSSLLFFAIFVTMLWVATDRRIYLIAGTALFSVGAVFAYRLFSHVQLRVEIWRDPFQDIEGSGFQLVQSLFALATGGAWGTGLGQGRPDLIPSVQTDFIFSALGEELGIAGALAVLTAYALFSARGFGLATRCNDDFSKLLTVGLVTAFAVQTILIVGGVTTLIPLTGITLPFMSYGGSSLLSNFVLLGLLMRISDTADSTDSPAQETRMHVAAGGAR
jgi:cell division protein FtsW (lipid II flippase)